MPIQVRHQAAALLALSLALGTVACSVDKGGLVNQGNGGSGSDAAAVAPTDAGALLHPRTFGTFPRVIAEYVKKRGVITLEDAVRKMTSLPAARMHLFDRGVIRAGLKADVTIFDRERRRPSRGGGRPAARRSAIRGPRIALFRS